VIRRLNSLSFDRLAWLLQLEKAYLDCSLWIENSFDLDLEKRFGAYRKEASWYL